SLTLRLSHPQSEALEAASITLSEVLNGFDGVTEIDSGISNGKPQLSIRLSAEGRAMGLTGADLAAQLRGPLQGATALEQQQGSRMVSVEVRLPPDARDSLSELRTMPIVTAEGIEVPLSRIAEIDIGRASATLTRIDGRR